MKCIDIEDEELLSYITTETSQDGKMMPKQDNIKENAWTESYIRMENWPRQEDMRKTTPKLHDIEDGGLLSLIRMETGRDERDDTVISEVVW